MSDFNTPIFNQLNREYKVLGATYESIVRPSYYVEPNFSLGKVITGVPPISRVKAIINLDNPMAETQPIAVRALFERDQAA